MNTLSHGTGVHIVYHEGYWHDGLLCCAGEFVPKDGEQAAGARAPSACDVEDILLPSSAADAGAGGAAAKTGTAQPLGPPGQTGADAALNGAILAATKAVTQRVASSIAAAIEAGAFPATATAYDIGMDAAEAADAHTAPLTDNTLGGVAQPSCEGGSSGSATELEHSGGGETQQPSDLAEQRPLEADAAGMEAAGAGEGHEPLDLQGWERVGSSPEHAAGESSGRLSSDAEGGEEARVSDTTSAARPFAVEGVKVEGQAPVSAPAAEGAAGHVPAGAGGGDGAANGVGLVAQLAAYFGGQPKQAPAPAGAALARPAAFRERHRLDAPGAALVVEGSAAAEQSGQSGSMAEQPSVDAAQASAEGSARSNSAEGAKQPQSRRGAQPPGQQQQRRKSASGWTVLDSTGLLEEQLTPAARQVPADAQRQDRAAATRLHSASTAAPVPAQGAELAPAQLQGMTAEVAQNGVVEEVGEGVGVSGRGEEGDGRADEAAGLDLAGKPQASWAMLRQAHQHPVVG